MSAKNSNIYKGLMKMEYVTKTIKQGINLHLVNTKNFKTNLN